MMRGARTMLVAVLIAVVVGLAAGWVAQVVQRKSIEDRMYEAEQRVRKKVRDVSR
jgi:uncharacterized protein HemX